MTPENTTNPPVASSIDPPLSSAQITAQRAAAPCVMRTGYRRAVSDTMPSTPVPGTHPRKKRRPGFVWELIGCAQYGHALVGTRSATIGDEDPHLAREMDGICWHRCLRCDAWLPVA